MYKWQEQIVKWHFNCVFKIIVKFTQIGSHLNFDLWKFIQTWLKRKVALFCVRKRNQLEVGNYKIMENVPFERYPWFFASKARRRKKDDFSIIMFYSLPSAIWEMQDLSNFDSGVIRETYLSTSAGGHIQWVDSSSRKS